MAKEQFELILLDFWEDYGLQNAEADPVATSGEHDNAGGDAGGFPT